MLGVMRLFYVSEAFVAGRFDLYSLHREIRSVDARLREAIAREPSQWELASTTVRAAADGNGATPQLVAQLRAYQGLEEATLEESLGRRRAWRTKSTGSARDSVWTGARGVCIPAVI
jgi:hypothetical protein